MPNPEFLLALSKYDKLNLDYINSGAVNERVALQHAYAELQGGLLYMVGCTLLWPISESLLDRLRQAQHALIDEAACQPGLPSTAIIRKIANLENAIAAVMALIEERQGSR